VINSLEFDESWSRSQFHRLAYPIHSKETSVCMMRIAFLGPSIYLSLPDTNEINKSYDLKLQISHGIPSKLQLAVKGLENDFYILTCMLRDLVFWRPTTKVYGAFATDLFMTRINPP